MKGAQKDKAPKKGKSGRSKTPQSAKKEEPKESIVTCIFANHTYTGVLRCDSLGGRTLEGVASSYVWSDGTRYEGPFAASVIEGRGKFLWPDGSQYEGEVSNGKRHGEGTYVAADGVRKYEGQWQDGKRHGMGRLSYDVLGESFYVGQWEAGYKHGEGSQVWRSTNSYQGQWRLGRIAGHGTMTWCDGGIRDQYTGHWENDTLGGAGRYTWNIPDPADADKHMPSQQMNNCYEGSWVSGVRHGVGTFSYASGARYNGNWADNIKDGHGEYTNEDGNVYIGQFAGDQCAEGEAGTSISIGKPVPHIGAEDNPVRRCIDISDLSVFHSSVQVAEEAMREVHNMLLRHLGELKKLYGQYRTLSRQHGVDPFVISMHQFWTMASDLGVVSLCCPLSRISRFITAGPRHYKSLAVTESEELRPLTPRSRPTVVDGSAKPHSEAVQSQAVEEDQAETHELDEEEGDAESIASGSPRSSIARTSVPQSPVPPEDQNGEPSPIAPEVLLNLSQDMAPRASLVGEVLVEPLHSRFWRREGSTGAEEDGGILCDIHSPSQRLLFREFVEAMVRLSLVCFNPGPALEFQLQKLLKKVLPAAGQTNGTFDFLVDSGLNEVFLHFSSPLQQLFREHAAGEGQYARPAWSQAEELERYRRRRHFGGHHRRVHLRARLDITTRVKDIFHILQQGGLLLPLGEHPQSDYVLHGAEDPSLSDAAHEALPGQEAHDVAVEEEGKEKEPTDLTDQGLEAPISAILDCNFRVSYLQVLSLLLEVQHTSNRKKLRWSMPRADTEEGELGLLDFLETEINFVEFQRLLLRMACTCTSVILPAMMSQHRRLEAYLQHVFLPSMSQPLARVEDKTVTDAETADGREAVTDAEAVAEFWQGFENDAEMESAIMGTPRIWPASYVRDVSDW